MNEAKEEALSRIDELKAYIDNKGSVPMMGLRDFIGMAGDLSSVGGLLLALEQFLR